MAKQHGTRGALRDLFRVAPGSRVALGAIDAGETAGWNRAAGEAHLAKGVERLADLQDRLWAEARRCVLIVLQGMDASGKDGTIKHVMTAFNPQGCIVTSFKVPTPDELAHDYLWRVHQRTPGAGEVGVFNRSHYEDVLVVRVHELVPRETWAARFDQINAFESLLSAAGTSIVKFMLHIDRDEQRRRFESRLKDPAKRWKFRSGDLVERKLWEAYQTAYEDVLARCSTDAAPWYVIPANQKWFRNLAVAEILGDVMEDLDPRYPPPTEDLSAIRVD
jgi:PPK2 family polyphosphate:nucleotide phosphotransferase